VRFHALNTFMEYEAKQRVSRLQSVPHLRPNPQVISNASRLRKWLCRASGSLPIIGIVEVRVPQPIFHPFSSVGLVKHATVNSTRKAGVEVPEVVR
jgi:hypothetical protein